MHRKICLLFVLLAVVLLCSCSFGGGKLHMIMYDDSDKKADIRMEQIFEAIQRKDRDALKAMFSERALSGAEDIDGRIDYLFDFVQGDKEALERTGFITNGSRKDGKKSVQLISWYTITTDKDKYRFFVIDYFQDTIELDNEGLYTLRVIRAADEDTQFTYWQDMEIPGIYKPEE